MDVRGTETGRLPAKAGGRPLILKKRLHDGTEKVIKRSKLHEEFPVMQDLVPEGQCGVWRVSHFRLDEEEARSFNLGCIMGGDARQQMVPGRYTRLSIGNTIMMSDTQWEQRTNWWPLVEARGDVLIAGLGLGMILWPILFNPEVRSVTVVEKDLGVIRLVSPSLQQHPNRDKLVIFNGDIDTWTPGNRKYDMIYFDIWPGSLFENLPHIARLHQRGKYWKRDKTSSMNSWEADHLRAERDAENRTRLPW